MINFLGLIPVRHIGVEGCGKIAFYFKETVFSGDSADSSNVIDIKGDPIKPVSIAQCGSCKQYLDLNFKELEQEDRL